MEDKTTAILSASHYDEKKNRSLIIQRFELTAEDGVFEHEMVVPEDSNEISISVEADDSKPDRRHLIRLVGYEVVE